MKIIINQDRELRFVGYNEKEGCNLLDISVYIAKSLAPNPPVYCVVVDKNDIKYRLLLSACFESGNYIVYKVLDLINLSFEAGEKDIYFVINHEQTEIEPSLYFSSFERHSLDDFLKEVK